MWSKLSNALKPSRQVNDSDSDRSSAHSAPTDVLARVYEQHPNLSLFHDNTNDQDIPFPSPSRPSPPPSPSKQRKKSIRVTAKLNSDSQPSSLRLPIGLPKKVRSHLHLKSNCTYSLSMQEFSHSSTSPTAQPHNSPFLATHRTFVPVRTLHARAQIHIGSTKIRLDRPLKHLP
jgi:hypothetical protein